MPYDTKKYSHMQKCIEIWEQQPKPVVTYVIKNDYVSNESKEFIVAEYYSNIAKRHIYDRYEQLDSLLGYRMWLSNSTNILHFMFSEIYEFRNKMIDVGIQLRQAAYKSIPDSTPGAFLIEKINYILKEMPEEHSDIINNFYIGLTFSAEAIAGYANLLSKHKDILHNAEITSIEQEISSLMRIAFRDVDAKKIQIRAAASKGRKNTRQEKKTDRSRSINAIRKFVGVVCVKKKSEEVMDKILSNEDVVTELLKFNNCRYEALGFNLRLVLCIIGQMHDKNIIEKSSFRFKSDVFNELNKQYKLEPSLVNYLSKDITKVFRNDKVSKFLLKTICE